MDDHRGPSTSKSMEHRTKVHGDIVDHEHDERFGTSTMTGSPTSNRHILVMSPPACSAYVASNQRGPSSRAASNTAGGSMSAPWVYGEPPTQLVARRDQGVLTEAEKAKVIAG